MLSSFSEGLQQCFCVLVLWIGTSLSERNKKPERTAKASWESDKKKEETFAWSISTDCTLSRESIPCLETNLDSLRSIEAASLLSQLVFQPFCRPEVCRTGNLSVFLRFFSVTNSFDMRMHARHGRGQPVLLRCSYPGHYMENDLLCLNAGNINTHCSS